MYYLIFLVPILYFLYQGYDKGIAKLLFRIAGLAGAYAATIFFTQPLTSWVTEQTPLKGVAAYIVTSVGIFIVVSMVLSVIFSVIYNVMTDRGRNVSQTSRGFGAVFGSLVGVAVGILLVWGASTFSQVLKQRDTSGHTDLTAREPANLSGLEEWARSAMGGLVKSSMQMVTGQVEMATITAKLLETPEVTLQHIKGLTESNEFKSLFQSPRNQEILNSGDIEKIQSIPEFKSLINNADFKAITQDLLDSGTSEPVDRQLAEKVRDMWARAQFVQQDPATQSLLNNSELRQALESGNYLDLMNSDKIIQLLERISSDEAIRYSETLKKIPNATKLIETTEDSFKNSEIYKWVDENGQVHYSDKKPEDKSDN